MTGALLFAVVVFWLWTSVQLTRLVLRNISSWKWRRVIAPVIFIALIILPVMDEIIGGFQFRTLCEKSATIKLGVKNPVGRTTRYMGEPIDEAVPGTYIPIFHSHIEYHDVMTNELVAQYDRYVAKGGILVRAVGISENNSPLTIGSPSCSGERGASLPTLLRFNVIN